MLSCCHDSVPISSLLPSIISQLIQHPLFSLRSRVAPLPLPKMHTPPHLAYPKMQSKSHANPSLLTPENQIVESRIFQGQNPIPCSLQCDFRIRVGRSFRHRSEANRTTDERELEPRNGEFHDSPPRSSMATIGHGLSLGTTMPREYEWCSVRSSRLRLTV